ncbi:hypothetical protein [Streptomyces rapamycinicus]|uniref:Uncharacterized protein n=2 Tax=Streptomyces rapamycinicus TaxID=1226757 RepID=A0A0A0NJ98_STRRN|nr:hypothetical protein [Streptomyces rapamycinicus]AGP56183.1 hypothetical protein M271_23360 [Streptomyces rapamycinicus NRRL 5491]MBB4783792.1 hypothetical protein [Streptomyces rapamycinicus]RLV80736.1 hypothetical protein D3C57_120165 [Streptomyces rapamycinicus NRRL 5491]UTO64149.1 hypothetical protein LJB45_18655 [Streptomyces rapamycinicus]UTP32104.1 hypothetical protein LIV37_23775 [Streptomyces rapamycinicus NRRL 5491]
MKVRMKAAISGTRDGEPWPARGGVVELPQDEAEHLIGAGLAEDAASGEPVEETATVKAAPETATPKRGRSSK